MEDKLDKNQDVFIQLIKCYITGSIKDIELYTDINWVKIFKLAYRTSLTPMICEVIQKNKNLFRIPETITNPIMKGTIYKVIQEEQKYRYIKAIVKKAQEEKIPFMIFKGPVIADAYSDYTLRISSDTDIFVAQEDKESMMNLLKRLGYIWLKEYSKEQVQNLMLPNLHYVELHTALWEDYSGSKIEILNTLGLTDPDKRISGTFCNITFETMGYEEQLIYLMFHFAKHMVLESASLRYLIDILQFSVKYNSKINFQHLRDCLTQLDYWQCYCLMCQIGVQYLGYNMEYFTFIEQVETDQLLPVLIILLNEVTEKNNDKYAWQMIYNMKPYLTGDYDLNISSTKRKLMYIFPTRRNMPEKYQYAVKSVFLVPIAWGHRTIDYIISKWILHRYRMPGTKRMMRMDDKLNTLKHMKLL